MVRVYYSVTFYFCFYTHFFYILSLKSIYSTLNYWHHRTDPSSWLSEALVRLAKRKLQNKLPRNMVILLCAQLLNVTPEKLESTLNWNVNYMAWHDGGTPEDHHVWMEDIE